MPLAYAAAVDIIGRSNREVAVAFSKFAEEARSIGLAVHLLLLLVLNPLWDIGHQQCLLSIVCGFRLLISALANFSQAFLSPSQLLFFKSGTVHQELFLNRQKDSTRSPCVLYCLHLCTGCGQSKSSLLIRISTGSITALRSSSSFLIRFGQ